MITKRHLLFNIAMIVIPWLSLLFLGRRNFKRFSIAGIFIVIFEIVNHLIGYKRKWWVFFDRKRSFLKDELPFSIGPYMPLSMWLLKMSYGNFAKFISLNVIVDAIFAFFIINVLEKVKIIGLHRLSNWQFFFYIHYKAYLMYGVQYLVENRKELRNRLGL